MNKVTQKNAFAATNLTKLQKFTLKKRDIYIYIYIALVLHFCMLKYST